jgi:hypothetical protein
MVEDWIDKIDHCEDDFLHSPTMPPQKNSQHPRKTLTRKNRGQTASGSAKKYIEEHLGQSGTPQHHTAERENSYVGHQANLHHTVPHTLKDDCSLKANSSNQASFKAHSTINYMAENQQGVQPQGNKNEKGLVGLGNLGNTCYMNSSLQALRNTTELTAFFLEGRHQDFLKGKQATAKPVLLTKAYVELLQCMWSGHRTQYIRPVGFFNDMC